MANEQTAEVLNQDGPIQDNAEETATATAEQAGATGQQATENDHDDETPRRKGGWLRKLERAQLEAEFWREKALGTAKPDDKKETIEDDSKPPVKPVRPKESDFKSWEEYQAARDKYEDERDEYHAKLTKYEVAQARKEVVQSAERQTVADGWATQVAEAESDPEMPNFRAVAFNPENPLSPVMLEAIVTSPFGARLAYEIGKDPDLAERIAEMPPLQAVKEIGKIESRIEAQRQAAEKDGEKTEETPAATTRAPRPPSPVRRTSSSSSEPSDEDDYKTWLKKREAQLAKR